MANLWSDSDNAMTAPLAHSPRPPELPPVGNFPRGRPSSSQVTTRGSFDRKQSNRPGTATTTATSDYFLPGVPQQRPMTTSTAMSQDLGRDTSLIFGEPHGVPHMRGVHTSQSALERDAANHWKKWGCGGKGPADMLIHLAEELKHCCWEEDDRCFPDKRMERIHEQMLHISQRLIRQPQKGPEQLAPLEHASKKEPPPTVLMSENTRLRQELKEARDMADALETTVTNYVTFKSKTKAREKWMRGYALQGRFLAYDVASAKAACAAWSNGVLVSQAMRKVRESSSYNIKSAQDIGLLAVCMSLWEANHRVVSARDYQILTLRSWMDRHKQDVLVLPLFIAWCHEVTHGCLAREKEKYQKQAEDLAAQAILEKRKLMQKFGDAAMAQLRKVINADEETCVKVTLNNWCEMIRMIHQEKKDEEARLAAIAEEEKQRQKRLDAAEKCFHRAARTLRTNTWRGWCDVVKYAIIAKQRLEQNMNMTMKGILGGEDRLKQACVKGWQEACRDDIQARQRAELATARAMLAKARARALSMLGKTTSEEDARNRSFVFTEWHRIWDAGKQLKKRKDGQIARAMKGLMVKDAEVVRKCFLPWKEMYQKRKARDLRLDQVTKSIGMNRNQILADVLQLWFKTTVLEGRQRREELARRQAEQFEAFMKLQREKASDRCFGRFFRELVKNTFRGWTSVVDAMKVKKKLLEQGNNSAMKMIGEIDVQLKRETLGAWVEATKADEKQRRQREMEIARQIIQRARDNIMKALQGKIDGAAQALIIACYENWKKDTKDTKLMRIRKEQSMKNGMRLLARINEQVLRYITTVWVELHKAIVARNKRIDQVERSLGLSGKGMKSKILLNWVKFTSEEKKERLEEERKKKIQQEIDREAALLKRRCEIADRWYNRIKRRQTEALWNFWISEVEAYKEASRKYEDNMGRATRLIMGSEAALQAEVFNMWKDLFHEELQILLKNKLADAELAKKLVAAARERAMNMFRKNLYASTKALILAVMIGWKEQLEEARKRNYREAIVMSSISRYNFKADMDKLCKAVGSWDKITKDSKMEAEMRKAAESAVRQSFLALCQGVIMRMHKRVAVTHVWDAWAERAIGR